MENNRILGNAQDPGSIKQENREMLEPLFEPYSTDMVVNGVYEKTVSYWDKKEEMVKESKVIIKLSKIKGKFYDQTAFPTGNPGASDMGQEVRKMQGISIVRAGREIDFGMFDYYDNENKPTHRWWGCEIQFSPELDEAFGVANNKQYVELKSVDEKDYLDEEVRPMWIQLRDDVQNAIKKMVKENEVLQKNSRSKEKTTSAAEDIVTDVEDNDEDQTGTITGVQKQIVDSKTVEEGIIQILMKTGKEEVPTEQEIAEFKNSSVKILYEDRGRSPFFDYDFGIGVACIYINIAHDFYKSFVATLMDDVTSKTAFELFIASFVKAVDKSESVYKEAYDRLMTDWEAKLKKYIDKQLHPGAHR